MKYCMNFVSNSSSTSFIIYNKTTEDKTILDFVLENVALILHFNESYKDTVGIGDVVKSAEEDYSHQILNPGPNVCTFGDEQGTTLGRVYDYILRDGGESKNFSWKYDQSLR